MGQHDPALRAVSFCRLVARAARWQAPLGAQRAGPSLVLGSLSAGVTAMLSPTSGQRAQGAGLRDHLGQAPLVPSRACSGFCLDSLPSERPSCSDTAQYERSGFCCLIRNSRLPCVPNIVRGWAHSRALCPPGPGESLDLLLGGWRCPVCGFCQRGSSFWVTVLCRSAPRLAADAGTGFPKREVETSEGSFIAVLSLLLTAIYIYIYIISPR